jgi:hypothetical protein
MKSSGLMESNFSIVGLFELLRRDKRIAEIKNGSFLKSFAGFGYIFIDSLTESVSMFSPFIEIKILKINTIIEYMFVTKNINSKLMLVFDFQKKGKI